MSTICNAAVKNVMPAKQPKERYAKENKKVAREDGDGARVHDGVWNETWAKETTTPAPVS